MISNRIVLVWYTGAASSAQIRLHDMVRHISELPNLSDSSPVGPESKEDSGIWKVPAYPTSPGQKPWVPLSLLVSLSLEDYPASPALRYSHLGDGRKETPWNHTWLPALPQRHLCNTLSVLPGGRVYQVTPSHGDRTFQKPFLYPLPFRGPRETSAGSPCAPGQRLHG